MVFSFLKERKVGKRFKPISAAVIILFFLGPKVSAEEIAVIVNAAGPLVNATESDVADIYTGEKRFEAGVKIEPLLYPEGPVKDTFLKESIKMTPKEYKLHWTKKVFQEGLLIPRIVPAADIVKTVREDKGRIGFLPRDAVEDAAGIKIIRIIK